MSFFVFFSFFFILFLAIAMIMIGTDSRGRKITIMGRTLFRYDNGIYIWVHVFDSVPRFNMQFLILVIIWEIIR